MLRLEKVGMVAYAKVVDDFSEALDMQVKCVPYASATTAAKQPQSKYTDLQLLVCLAVETCRATPKHNPSETHDITLGLHQQHHRVSICQGGNVL